MPKQQPTDDGEDFVRVRPFAAILQDLGRGEVVDEAALQLQSLVNAVLLHGKAGTFTLKMRVEPMKGNVGALLVKAVAQSSPPVGEPTAAVFFSDAEGNLLREDPKQMKLPLRDATVDTRTGVINE